MRPYRIGVIFDSSGSMASKMDRAKDAVTEFFKTANPQDEFFMVTFSDEPEMVAGFTSSVDEITDKLLYTVPQKRTALLDAIYMGVSKMRQAKYPKKAILIISDGGDNHSRYTEGEIKVFGEGKRTSWFTPSAFTTAIFRLRKSSWARNCWAISPN